MAEGIRKSYRKNFIRLLFDEKLKRKLSSVLKKEETVEHVIKRVRDRALKATDRDTYQAMEGFVHNLNTSATCSYTNLKV